MVSTTNVVKGSSTWFPLFSSVGFTSFSHLLIGCCYVVRSEIYFTLLLYHFSKHSGGLSIRSMGKFSLMEIIPFFSIFLCISSLNLVMLLLITRDLLMPTWWVDNGKFATCTRHACQPVECTNNADEKSNCSICLGYPWFTRYPNAVFFLSSFFWRFQVPALLDEHYFYPILNSEKW